MSYFSFYLDLGRQGRREEDKIKERKGTHTEIPLVDVITTLAKLLSVIDLLSNGTREASSKAAPQLTMQLGSTLGISTP